ncbi:MAG: cell division protein FtsB, partial [Acinetobacter sp.]
QMSTISTQYKPIYLNPNSNVDLRTNESPEPTNTP